MYLFQPLNINRIISLRYFSYFVQGVEKKERALAPEEHQNGPTSLSRLGQLPALKQTPKLPRPQTRKKTHYLPRKSRAPQQLERNNSDRELNSTRNHRGKQRGGTNGIRLTANRSRVRRRRQKRMMCWRESSIFLPVS